MVVLCPKSLQLGPLPSLGVALVVAAGSVLTAGVLLIWAALLKTRGSHGGVNRMVDGGVSGVVQHARLGLLAVANALAEEVCGRCGGVVTQFAVAVGVD